ncbi:3-oxoadipate enol-lactonase [Arenibaculum pallidiluteum]|uniref:3-oxoadipate enol-lactonase n=1 Tax=Arenibaculum pallidiluteum TaxID=2812559 RepID=UPI001A97A22D|nr:3-oxoadipate enol-lactonase [Arenibaculum pallidiluteum]
MPFVRAGGLTVHYDLTAPEGAPTVLFSNSLGTNLHVWDPVMPALAGRYRILRYDMRGHGMTDAPPAGAGYSIDVLAGDALALLDALGIGRVHVCGLSIGGMVAQKLGVTAPDRVASLILCDTANRIGPPSNWDARVAAIRANGIESIADAVMERWFTPRFRADRPEIVQGAVNMMTRTPVEGYIGCALAVRDADLAADDARIACPTLVLAGDQDLATPPDLVEATARAIPGASFALIPSASHIPCMEQPDALARQIRGFLDGIAA